MLLNDNWLFYLGDMENAYEKRHKEDEFRKVTLPHDWAMDYPKDKANSSGTGYVVGGIAWYRKHFTLKKEDVSSRTFIYFDGIYKNSQVWINGYYLGRRPYGYSSFRYDVTDFLTFDDNENVIAVRVDHHDIADSRWFTGSGITRKVTMETYGDVYPEENGIFFTSAVENLGANNISADICVTNELKLTDHSDKDEVEVKVINALRDSNGQIVCVCEKTCNVGKGEVTKVETTGTLANPSLWSVDEPYLYTLKTTVTYIESGVSEVIDERKVGIRKLEFDCNKGFYLNGKKTMFKGVCVHHDGGALGAAMVKGVWRRRLEKLKTMGCNAIRTSHNPHMPELYDLCDEMGFLVMDEAFDEWEGCKNKWFNGHNVYPPKHQGYSEDFPQWHRADLTSLVRRDRNHPCVVIWSIGNEIDYPNDPYNHPSFLEMTGNNDANKPEEERKFNASRPNMERLTTISRELYSIVKESDTTRPVSAAVAFPELSANLGYISHLDIVGYNYKEHLYDEHHKRFPDKHFYGSENGQQYSAWKCLEKYPYVSGQFLWIGIDYLGECAGWPKHTFDAGNLSTAGFEKPRYYARQSWWSEKKVIHISTGRSEEYKGEWKYVNDSWNYIEGEEIEVRCYTNCSNPELKINDKLVPADKRTYNEELGFYVWNVPFEKGKITATATEDGETVSHSLETTNTPAAIKMKVVSTEDIIQLYIKVVDDCGRRVVADNSKIFLKIEGDCEYLGMDNGDPIDVSDYRGEYRNCYEGRTMAYVRRLGDSEIKITAWNPDLKKAEIVLENM